MLLGGKSKRVGVKNLISTPDELGPGYYVICDSEQQKENCAPFLSSTIRKTVDAKHAGELKYHVIETKTIPLGNSLQYTADRFAYKDVRWISPGPTDYNPIIPPKKCKTKIRPCGPGKLQLGNVSLSFGINPPSIPTKIDENGYTIVNKNVLVKIPSTKHDQSLGPAFYHVPREEYCFTSKRYSGWYWYKRTGRDKRNTFVLPGPGDYEIDYKPCQPSPQDLKCREIKKKEACIPRSYTEIFMKETLREDLPGPGQYETSSDFPHCIPCSIYPRPFISRTERLVDKIDDKPGPGEYSPCDCIKLKRDFATSCVPFGSFVQRLNYKIHNSPGPADYASDLPKCNRVKCPVPFEAKTERWHHDDLKLCKVSDEPSPDQYDVLDKEIAKKKCDCSVFKSIVPRFKRRKREKTPPPLEGRITWPVKISRPPPKEGSYVFRSEVERNYMNIKKHPGPGDYEAYDPECKRTGFYLSCLPRFKEDSAGTPGPGYYEVNPNFTDSTARTKFSHNKIIQAEIKRTEPKTRPPKIKKKRSPDKAEYQRSLDKRLRWFETPVMQYIHC